MPARRASTWTCVKTRALILLRVTDDGRGFDVDAMASAATGHYGLTGNAGASRPHRRQPHRQELVRRNVGGGDRAARSAADVTPGAEDRRRPGRITVLCVDDHRIVREGLRMIINSEPDMTVVDAAATGGEAVARYRQHAPDITLMDLQLPDMGGVDAIRAIRELDATTHASSC